MKIVPVVILTSRAHDQPVKNVVSGTNQHNLTPDTTTQKKKCIPSGPNFFLYPHSTKVQKMLELDNIALWEDVTVRGFLPLEAYSAGVEHEQWAAGARARETNAPEAIFPGIV